MPLCCYAAELLIRRRLMAPLFFMMPSHIDADACHDIAAMLLLMMLLRATPLLTIYALMPCS